MNGYCCYFILKIRLKQGGFMFFAYLFLILVPFNVFSLITYTVNSGTFVEIINPPSLEVNDYTSDTDLFIVRELVDVTLIDPLPVDVLISDIPSYPHLIESTTALLPDTIPIGTRLTSFLIFADSDVLPGAAHTGSITFSEDMFALSVLKPNQDISQGVLGLPIPYGSYPMDLLPTALFPDRVTVTTSDTLSFTGTGLRPFGNMDGVRVMFLSPPVPIPEPSTYLTLGAFLLMLAGYTYKKHMAVNKLKG